MTPELVGTVLEGKYRVTSLLGAGGMGVVYAAEHVKLGRPVAVKLLKPELAGDRTAVRRLRQEAVAAGQIGNPHIVEVLDLGVTPGGAPFIVMEHLRGRSLADALAHAATPPVPWVADVVCQVLAGLAAAHAHRIVHRDLKPENVFLVPDQGREFVKLLDFGVSKVAGDPGKTRLTQTGAVLGTPHYMAPEQASGSHDLDHRVDIWATGVILFQALTGRLPFDGDGYNAILAAILTRTPQPPHALRPDVPPALEAVVLQALARHPAARFPSAEAFREALLPFAPGGRTPVAFAASPRTAAPPAVPPGAPPQVAAGREPPALAPAAPFPSPPGPVPPAPVAASPPPHGPGMPAVPTPPAPPFAPGPWYAPGTPGPASARAAGAPQPRGSPAWFALAGGLSVALVGAAAWLLVARPWQTEASSPAAHTTAREPVTTATASAPVAAAADVAPAAAPPQPPPAPWNTTHLSVPGTADAPAPVPQDAAPPPDAGTAPEAGAAPGGEDEKESFFHVQEEVTCRSMEAALRLGSAFDSQTGVRVYYATLGEHGLTDIQYAALMGKYGQTEEGKARISAVPMRCYDRLRERGDAGTDHGT